MNERASCAADWRLFCPESWDDDGAPGEVAAAAIRRRRDRGHIPDGVRHTEKWRLALEMIGYVSDTPPFEADLKNLAREQQAGSGAASRNWSSR